MRRLLFGPLGNPLRSEAAAFALLVRAAVLVGLVVAVILLVGALG